ncbi:MAG: hypothetical protein JNK04_12455, partial [Myxococcales bacterium]|nr:hypothetical protein [Myxococcales bacterium]
MHFASRSRLLTLIAFVTACGARTELPVANSGGAEGDGGSGGEGGAPAPSCVLTQLAGEIVLVGGEDAPQRSPALEDIDGSAVFLTHIAAPSFSTDERLGRGIFNWGDPWPPTVSFDVGGPACRRFEAYGSLALIADPAGTPFLASVSSADPLLQLAVGETTPVFFDATTPVMFGGFTIAADSQLYLVVPTADFDFDFRLEWGCGSTPVRADAIRSGESYLVAMTSGTDFGGCGIPGGAGPATRLQIARFTT